MEIKDKLIETPETFLDSLGAHIKEKDGVDVDLAKILTTNILKAAPAQNAVTQAKDAILKLAEERAKQEATDD